MDEEEVKFDSESGTSNPDVMEVDVSYLKELQKLEKQHEERQKIENLCKQRGIPCPGFIEPTFDTDTSLKTFPVMVNIDIEGMAKKVGNRELMEFLNGVIPPIQSIVQRHVHAKFEDSFSGVPEEWLGCLVMNRKTEFEFKIVEINSMSVVLEDLDFDSNTSTYSTLSGDRQEVKNAVFREEFDYVGPLTSEGKIGV